MAIDMVPFAYSEAIEYRLTDEKPAAFACEGSSRILESSEIFPSTTDSSISDVLVAMLKLAALDMSRRINVPSEEIETAWVSETHWASCRQCLDFHSGFELSLKHGANQLTYRGERLFSVSPEGKPTTPVRVELLTSVLSEIASHVPSSPTDTDPSDSGRFDVNQDAVIDHSDMEAIVDHLNYYANGQTEPIAPTAAFDVSRDGVVSPLDALLVVNAIKEAESRQLGRELQSSADVLAAESSDELLASEQLRDKILKDLIAIAGSHPELSDVRERGSWEIGTVIVNVSRDAFDRFQQGEFRELDALTQSLGHATIESHRVAEDYYYLAIHFEQPYHPERLVEFYSSVDGVEGASPNAYWGSPSYGIQVDGSSYTYFRSWGDCPSGCIYGHRWQFEVVNNTVTLAQEGGDPL
jgi:hypothetical protein